MTTVPAAVPSLQRTRASARGYRFDRAFRFLTSAAGLSVFAVLALIAFFTAKEAWPVFRHEGLSFFTTSRWDVPAERFGALAFAAGTLVVSSVAIALAVPISLGVALFVTEVAPRRARKPIVALIDLLAAIPSVVYGLWGVRVLTPLLGHWFPHIASSVHGVPLLGTLLSGRPVSGESFAAAGFVVAIMITPIITSLTREVFATVPTSQKEGAVALGATRWEMIRGSVLPHSRGGIVGAVIIGLGRALGETIAVALVVGSSTQVTARLFSPGNTMAAVIANQFGEATGVYRSALIGLGVVLFLITIVIGALARAYLARSARRSGAPA